METVGPLIEGNLAVDFINTEEIYRGVKKDYINSAKALSVWLSEEELSGALSRLQLPFEAKVWSTADMRAIHQLRNQVRAHLERLTEGKRIDDQFVQLLEWYIEQAPFTLKLSGGRSIYVPIGSSVKKLCSLVAADIFHLIDNHQLEHIRKCNNPKCLFMFIDATGRRKWCSMKRCGNRAKVTKHLRKREYLLGQINDDQ